MQYCIVCLHVEGLLCFTINVKPASVSVGREVLCVFVCLFETRFHPVAQPGQELTMHHRLDLNSKQSSCLSRIRAWFTPGLFIFEIKSSSAAWGGLKLSIILALQSKYWDGSLRLRQNQEFFIFLKKNWNRRFLILLNIYVINFLLGEETLKAKFVIDIGALNFFFLVSLR